MRMPAPARRPKFAVCVRRLGTEPTLFTGPVVAAPKAKLDPRPPPSTGPATAEGRPSIVAN